METIYFTITGTDYHYGHKFIEPGMLVKITKDHDNKFDKEAIKVEMEGLGLIGYVANSHFTVLGESMSAGRIYDKIEESAKGKVLYVLPKGILCILEK